MKQLGTNIKVARQARGFTQEQVAHAIGMTRPTYALVESNQRDITTGQAETLAAMLHVSVEELLGASTDTSTLINPQTSIVKYKQMLLNALQAGADQSDGKITKTKLAKILYLADFSWYYNHLTPMSGMSYRRLPRGPVPDIFFRAVDELIEDGAVRLEESGRAFMLSLIEKGEAPSNQLSASEKAMIRAIGEAWRDKQTEEIVNFTHEQLPWQICREGEIIPYGLITQEDPQKVYGNALIAKL